MHWPDDFFAPTGWRGAGKKLARLTAMNFARLLFRTRFIWVAHNAKPHDIQTPSRHFTHPFLRSLDGIIYLSAYSHEVITTRYPIVAAVPKLITVHGHYRDSMKTPPSLFQPVSGKIRLAYMGQIRPYKNVLELVTLVAGSKCNVSLSVTGRRIDERTASELVIAAANTPHIELDIRDEAVPDAELEAAVDASHAVVLPYRDILNSGAALYALSRNRPVLAPRLGSLTELQTTVGSDWLYLYDGALTNDVLESFITWLRDRGGQGEPNLSAYDWEPIGKSIYEFLHRLTSRK